MSQFQRVLEVWGSQRPLIYGGGVEVKFSVCLSGFAGKGEIFVVWVPATSHVFTFLLRKCLKKATASEHRLTFLIKPDSDMNDLSIPWSRVAAFVRQHTHDVRNTINCMDLEMELMSDVVSDQEVEDGMKRVRGQLRSLELQMRALSAAFHDPRPMATPLGARVLLQIWREKHIEMGGASDVQWLGDVGEQQVNVDVEMMSAVFKELSANAAAFSPGVPLTVSVTAKGDRVIFELREPKKEPEDPSAWGQPLCSSARGHYGLGLWRAKRMTTVNEGTLSQRYDEKEKCLISEVSLPVEK